MTERPLALVVHAHPNPESFNAFLARSAEQALSERYEVAFLDLYACGFNPTMSRRDLADYQAAEMPTDPISAEHVELVRQAHTLVFVYPTWWMTLPAMLKGWVERVMRPNVAFVFDSNGLTKPGLESVKRVVGITTYGTTRWTIQPLGDGGKISLLRSLGLSSKNRVEKIWLGMYGVDNATTKRRAAFVRRVDKRLRSL